MRNALWLLVLTACSNERTRYGYGCPESAIPDEPSLACTGLYGIGGRGFAERRIADDVQAYTPAFEQWTDGLTTQRYVRVPRGSTIDKTDPKAWRFPDGTQFWMELSWEGRPVETRYMTKRADGAWWRATYVWNGDDTKLLLTGRPSVPGVAGGAYQIPAQSSCDECHAGRVLGFDAVGAGSFTIAGDELTRRVAGYVHANCGTSCHNTERRLETVTGGVVDMDLRLDPTRPNDVPFIASTVGVLSGFPVQAPLLRIAPGDPEHSAVYVRMSSTKLFEHMPPVGTTVLPQEAIADMAEFIKTYR